ncbi:MAG TPA: DUF2975 domain-containing protein [Flavobacterium sp.]|nr:DUF2975 domain-containing protein [Flavobacterium sp.]
MKRSATIFLQLVIVLIGIATFIALLWEPQIEGRNVHATNFEIYFKDPFLALVYVGSIPFFVALYQVFKILGYIKQNKVFSQTAIKALHTIKYCAIAIICFVVVEEIFIMLNHGNDDAAGGVFMGILIILGSVVVAAASITFEHILQDGMDIKNETSDPSDI